MNKMYPVKPFYAEYCQKCMLTGCYPWNQNPFLLCGNMGGMVPALQVVEGDVSIQCLQYKPVDFDCWQRHMRDLKREAEANERIRLKAMNGDAFANEILPAESVELLKEEAK